ncbi:hypothetical protein [Acidovorax sp. sic0104]|uniref:hypothetical protein n=1 Tax=Acidovorax sp. sic0104 TaxID=2854784 RepID=UPI001C436AF6|nr:hypothetical protein [Acidovorax sp. sic0104]MBV7541925.1 hypothetical protein [Acidovorax sp. sic0104]
MILAKKNGWLIAVRVLRKTRYGSHVQPIDSAHPQFVSKRDADSMLCENVATAMAFINGK